MSSWGNKDGLSANGTVSTSDSTNEVVGIATDFTNQIMEGDYIFVAGAKYQVTNVIDDTNLLIDGNAASTEAGETLVIQQGPKWLSNVALSENVYSIQRIFGSDLDESGSPSNRERNLKQTGWYNVMEYEDSLGNKRYKNELLVSLSKDFTKDNAFDSDGNALVDYFITILSQPEDFSTDNANATVDFTIVAEGNDDTMILEYQWQESSNGIVFTDVVDGGVYSGANTNVLSISNVTGLDGQVFKVQVTGSNVSAYVDNVESDVSTIEIING